MRVHDNLAEWIRFVARLVSVSSGVLKELQHRRNSPWMNTILGFFQAKQASRLSIELHHRQGQEPKRSIRQISRRMPRPIARAYQQRKSFVCLVAVNNYVTHIFQK